MAIADFHDGDGTIAMVSDNHDVPMEHRESR